MTFALREVLGLCLFLGIAGVGAFVRSAIMIAAGLILFVIGLLSCIFL